MVDARGRRVLPGFNDSHVHFVQAGGQLTNVHLKDAESPETFARRIRERERERLNHARQARGRRDLERGYFRDRTGTLAEVEVDMTIVGGRNVYEREG